MKKFLAFLLAMAMMACLLAACGEETGPSGEAKSIGIDALFYVIAGVVGVNGIPEAIVAAVVTAVICPVLLKVFPKHSA